MLLTTDPELKSAFEVNVKYWKLEDQPKCKGSGYENIRDKIRQ
jgi:hypothetical protein